MEGMMALAAALTMAVSTIFPAISQGKTAVAALEAIARQPAEAGNLRTTMILGMAFIESLTIYGLLIAIMIVAQM